MATELLPLGIAKGIRDGFTLVATRRRQLWGTACEYRVVVAARNTSPP